MNEVWETVVDLTDALLGLDVHDPFVLLLIACLTLGLTVNAAKARWRGHG